MNFDIDKHQSPWHIDVDRYTSKRAAGHEKGIPTMIHMYGTWLIGRHDAQDERNQMHLAAIREARIATEYRQNLAEAPGPASPAQRGALATAGTGSSIDLCGSCA
jgi:hypothetical protein